MLWLGLLLRRQLRLCSLLGLLALDSLLLLLSSLLRLLLLLLLLLL